jgi:Ca-activated chloride channel homolog
MTFLHPDRLWLLGVLPALMVVYVWLQYRKSRFAVRFTNIALIDTIAPRRVNWRQHVAVLLALLTLGFAIGLFAQPSKLVKVPRLTPVTVVLTMDVSLSMQAADVPPNRITAAKNAAQGFLKDLPTNFDVALVSFAGSATVVTPPTQDRQRISAGIDGLRLAERTATGEGIYTALDVVKQAVGAGPEPADGKVSAIIVLLSDGYRTAGRSQVSAARAAKAQGVPVYTVALGTQQGQIVVDDRLVMVPVETGQLKQIADISGGKAYTAESAADLSQAYHNVTGRESFTLERGDATSSFIGYLVLLSVVSTAAGLFVASRWP